MLTLEEVKEFLRVDGDEEDKLITSLIVTATELVENIIRQKVSDFEELPETLRQASLYAIATFYENRQGGKDGLDTAELIEMIKRMVFAYRKEAF